MRKNTRADKKDAAQEAEQLSETPRLGEEPGTEETRWTRRASLVALALVLVFIAVVRLRVAEVPLERDEGEYAYAAQLILQGFPPYQLAYNMKFPGTYYAYSVVLALFGETAWGVHVGLLFVNAATIVLLFLLGRHLLRDSAAAAVAAIAFGFLSLDRGIMGVFGHATHYVILAAVAGLLLLCHAMTSKKALTFLGAGALLGVSVLMKQNGIFFLAAGIAIAAWNGLRTPEGTFRTAALRTGAVAAGGAIVFAALCVLLAVQGVFGKFWFWTFQYANEYVRQKSLSDAWGLFLPSVSNVIYTNKPLWILAGTGIVLLWAVRWSAHTRMVLSILLTASLIAVCPGLYFREHYFILLLPAAGLFSGVAVCSLHRAMSRLIPGKIAQTVAIGIFAAAAGMYVVGERNYLFAISPQDLSRQRYGASPFVEAPEVARYIQAHTEVSDRIAVLGSEPELYFYAKRKSVTGYIYTYGLMERQKYSQRMQDEMIADITAAHPKYIVYVVISTSWMAENQQERILTWSQKYLRQCYDVAGIADILPGTPTQYVWDADVAGYRPRSQFLVITFKAKGNEPCASE
jgi:hypothetical protein